MTTKEEAMETLARVDAQRAKLAPLLKKALDKFLKPEVRDPAGRMLESMDKQHALLSMAIQMQENIRRIFIERGATEEQVENAIRLYRKEAKA